MLRRALADEERGLGSLRPRVDDDALAFLAAASDGDARTALNVLEMAVRQRARRTPRARIP